MAKEFTYRGHTVDQLKQMELDAFAKLLPARQRRSLKRGIKEQQKTLLEDLRKAGDAIVKTHVRNMVILPEMIGKRISIYDGKDFNLVDIKPEMVGHYLGEFSLTRERVAHSGPGIGATRGTKFISVK